jgi:cytoskeletal protein CcmA (bactofilin family)
MLLSLVLMHKHYVVGQVAVSHLHVAVGVMIDGDMVQNKQVIHSKSTSASTQVEAV